MAIAQILLTCKTGIIITQICIDLNQHRLISLTIHFLQTNGDNSLMRDHITKWIRHNKTMEVYNEPGRYDQLILSCDFININVCVKTVE